MGSRKHISRKDISASAFTPKPKPNILQTRPFSSGKHARSSELPKTDILQTRPFSNPTQKSSGAEAQPLTPEAVEKAEVFGYKAGSIPAFAPSTPQATIQREEVTEEDTSSQSEAETEQYQPIWGFARELSKPQSEEVSPQSGTIQLKCDECGAEKEEEKLPETIQTKAEISEAKDYTQNRFESIRGDKETYIWQPKSIGKLDTKLLARNQQQGLSITKAKPSRIRAKKLSELVGNTETLSNGEVANPQSEVAATAETKELHETIQAKLTVGEAGDKYEQEADAVAAQVVSKINSPQPEESVQRQSELGESVPNITVMRHSEGGVGEGVSVTLDVEEGIQRARGGGQGLDESVREPMEGAFGADFSGVKVHTDAQSDQLNRSIQAKAFTTGQDIFFRQGEYNPGSKGGQELLAHELTHVVQQTGAIQRNLEVGKKDTAQEKEVDSISKVVTENEQSGYISPALQMRSALRSSASLLQLRSSSLSKSIIQRAITTSGGEWDTDQYDLRKDKDSSGNSYPANLGVRGVDMKLKFTPGNNVDAELIGLTQSVQAFVNNSPSYTNATNQGMSIRSADAINVNTGAGETDEGTAIDRAAPYNNPIYAVQSQPSASLDDNNTAAGWGQNGWHYTDSSGNPQHQDATLIDGPTRPYAAKDSRHIFETTALATKGVQSGTYYGSVRWGWRTDDQGNFTKIPLSKVSDGVPSSTFMKSAEIWNASKSSTGADTVDLPVVDVKVTTAPVTLMPPVPLRNISLPVGTRVQIIEEWHSPLLTGKIKVIDGPHTGTTGQVSYQEWGNIADERG